MSRTNRVLKGVSFTYLNQAASMVVALWLPPFLLGHLGRESFGHWVIAGQVVAVLALLDLGVLALAPRDISIASGVARRSETSEPVERTIREFLSLLILQTPVICVGALVAWLYARTQAPDLSVSIGVMLAISAITFPLRLASTTLHGTQDFSYAGIVQFASFLLNTVVTALMVTLGFGFNALVAGWTVGQLVMHGAAVARVVRRYPGVTRAVLPWMAAPEARAILRRSMWPSIAQLVHVAVYGADILLIGAFRTATAVALYSFAYKLTSLGERCAQMLLGLAGPGFGELNGEQNDAAFQNACIAFGQASILVGGALATVFCATNSAFVAWWVGPENSTGPSLTVLLTAASASRLWLLSLYFPLYFCGQERTTCVAGVLDGVVTIGAMALFIHLFGPIGAPLGSLLGVWTTNIPLLLRATARTLRCRVWTLLGRLAPFFCLAVLGAAGSSAYSYLQERAVSPWSWLVPGILSALAYAVGGYAVVRRSALGAYVLPRLRRLFGWVAPQTTA